MNQNLIGIVVSFAFVFLVLGISEAAARLLHLRRESTRKLAHILLCNWILLGVGMFTHVLYACLVPACFVILNLLSGRFGLFRAIERESDRSLGTVWYALSLLILTMASFLLKMPYVAVCGMFCMGYGDGFAAVFGQRFGSGGSKSMAGSLAMLLFSFVAVFGVLLVCGWENALPAAVICSIAATVLEAVSGRGTDNLTVPLGTGFLVFLLSVLPQLTMLLLCSGLTLLISAVALRLHALTRPGAVSAFALGLLLYLTGGWIVWLSLIVFFITGSMVGRIGKARKLEAVSRHEHHGARTVKQVLANGLPALLFTLLYTITDQSVFLTAALVTLAGATADTCSSELGMLSGRQPISILSFQPVEKGLSGGVTAAGLLGATLGSAITSIPTFFALGSGSAMTVWVCGILCSLLDSVLGAALQAKYRLPNGAGLTEQPVLNGVPLQRAGGIRVINNDMVNFISIFLCGIIYAVVLF